MATLKSWPSLDGPSNTVNCQVSWSVNNGHIPLNDVAVYKGTGLNCGFGLDTTVSINHGIPWIPYRKTVGTIGVVAKWSHRNQKLSNN